MTSNPSFWQAVQAALLQTDPACKIEQVTSLWATYQTGEGIVVSEQPTPLLMAAADMPGRPAKPELVSPRQVKARSIRSEAGRKALIHAVCHIEFNAINLALDAVQRFADMPLAYYIDWLSVAADEARHFAMLQTRLQELGCDYGELPAHNGLWEMAADTDHDVMVRMALVPRVLEARGLDVTPAMIDKLLAVDDTATVDILRVILAEEVRHVEIGSRWFRFCCEPRGLEPDATFLQLLTQYYGGKLRGPFNIAARKEAGFSDVEMHHITQAAKPRSTVTES